MDKWKVLLVDDELEFVTTLAERLELRGIDASIANDGEEALARIDADRPEVVVLDVLMPGLGGLAVLDQIRTKDPQIKVILLTGRGAVQEGDKKLPQGASGYLIKPVNIDELIEKMREAMGASDPSRPGGKS